MPGDLEATPILSNVCTCVKEKFGDNPYVTTISAPETLEPALPHYKPVSRRPKAASDVSAPATERWGCNMIWRSTVHHGQRTGIPAAPTRIHNANGRSAFEDVPVDASRMRTRVTDNESDSAAEDRYYGQDLALVHHLGFGFHADACAPGILALLEPIRERRGLVLEVGCGSGLLTRHLVDAGHRVIATDASPAMVELAKEYAAGAEDVRVLVLPDDPLPEADAVVSVGHVVNYVGERDAVEQAIVAIARAVRPGGVFAIGVCDLEWATLRQGAPGAGRIGDDWAVVVEFSIPAPDRFVRDIATFLRNDDGTWRRSDERHDNVLLDTTTVPALLAPHGVDVTIGTSFGTETLPAGLRTVIGRRPRC